MEAEWDVILHQRVGELEQIKDPHIASLHFPLLSPHGELGWHVAVRYEDDSTSHNNKRVSRHNFFRIPALHQVQWVLTAPSRCKVMCVCAVSILIIEMPVPSLPESPAASMQVVVPVNINI